MRKSVVGVGVSPEAVPPANQPFTPNSSDPDPGEPERVLFEGNPALVPTVGALVITILTLGLALIYFAFRRKTLFYRITTERVVVESGLLSKQMDEVALYRINDYVVERPFGQRLMGTGNLTLKTLERDTNEVRLKHLKTDVVTLYEVLRKATEIEKQRRGVRVVDYE